MESSYSNLCGDTWLSVCIPIPESILTVQFKKLFLLEKYYIRVLSYVLFIWFPVRFSAQLFVLLSITTIGVSNYPIFKKIAERYQKKFIISYFCFSYCPLSTNFDKYQLQESRLFFVFQNFFLNVYIMQENCILYILLYI